MLLKSGKGCFKLCFGLPVTYFFSGIAKYAGGFSHFCYKVDKTWKISKHIHIFIYPQIHYHFQVGV